MATILMIDDSTFERRTVGDILRAAGYSDVVEAENGEKGLDKFDSEKPDLVLLDIRMPGMSGVDVLKKIVEKDSNANVLMVSIVRDQESIDECLKLGAKGYVNKPVTEEKLIPKVKEILG